MTLMVLLTIGLASPSPAKAETLSAEALAKLDAAAHGFYSDVQQENWAGAMNELQRIGKAAEPVLRCLDEAGSPLTKAVVRSARALSHRDRSAALHAGNRIIEWAALRIAATKPNTALDAIRLGYLTRELQIEADSGNQKKTAARIAEIQQCWDRLRAAPPLAGSATIKQFGGDVMRQLELARSPEALSQAQASLSRLLLQIGDGSEVTTPLEPAN